MTHIPKEPTAMEAGHVTDRAVAARLGWINLQYAGFDKKLAGKRPDGTSCYVPEFSTDPAAALQALEEWQRKNGFAVGTSHNPGGVWRIWSESNRPLSSDGKWPWIEATTLPLAIARLIVGGGKEGE